MPIDHVNLFPSGLKIPIDQYLQRYEKPYTVWTCPCGNTTFYWTSMQELVCTACQEKQYF
jgi:hypothetical protein